MNDYPMYNFLVQEDNPFPMQHEVAPLSVLCMQSHAGAAYANIEKTWHVDFLVSGGDVLMKCQNIRDGANNYTIIRPNGKVTIW
jgi:hypothetical protein